MSELPGSSASKSLRGSPETDERSLLFLFSALMFRMGLALATFEQVRPFSIQLSDYCFFLSALLFLSRPKSRLLEAKGSGVLPAGLLILSGALLSLGSASSLNGAIGPLTRLFILFGLFAPLGVIHSKNIRKNVLFLIGGISLNCAIALLQAWAFPGIVAALLINPVTPDMSYMGRFQGLASHPNVLGLSAALGVLIAVGLLSSEGSRHIRWRLVFTALICTLAGLLSGSRTFLVPVIPGLIVLTLSQKLRGRAVARALAALVILWGALTYLAPTVLSEYAERLGLTGLEFSPDYGRLVTAALAVEEISQKPILGWGVDHFGEAGMMLIPEIAEVVGAHLTFLQYWYAAGLLGATGFLALFGIPAMRMLRRSKESLSINSRNALSLGLGVYVLLFVVSNLHPILYNRFLYVPVFMFAGFAAHLRGSVEARLPARQCLPATRPA